jgi:hypothetical protein
LVLGAMGQPGNMSNVTDKQNSLGTFKVLDSVTGDVLKSIKMLKEMLFTICIYLIKNYNI